VRCGVWDMISLHLSNHPRTGTITIHGERWTLATWHKAAEGQMHATTTDGERVTLATADEDDGITGSLTIGNTPAARIWTIKRGVRDGATLTGTAYPVPSDQWLDDYVERMAGRVRG
jgi:hypothetical protein